MSNVKREKSDVKREMSNVKREMSDVKREMSNEKRKMVFAICYLLFEFWYYEIGFNWSILWLYLVNN